MYKKQKEEREIKGEVEGYSTEITPFPGGRGSRGIKVENEWHNIIGYRDFLSMLDDNFKPGSFVVFKEVKNRKGYWDIVENSLKKISKQEAYNQSLPETPQQPAPVEEIEIQGLKTPADKLNKIKESFQDLKKSGDEMMKNISTGMQKEKQTEKEFWQQRKHAIEDGQEYLEIPRDDVIKMANKLMQDPLSKAIELPIRNVSMQMQLKATLMITIVSGLGPKIILEIDKSDTSSQHHLMLLLLAETEIAKELLKQKILASKRNITIEETISKSQSQDTPTDSNLSAGKP